MAVDAQKTSRQIDPVLSAKAEAYGLMIAAKANSGQTPGERPPGERPWTCHQFADLAAVRLARETCEHEGFEVRPASAEYPNTLAIRARR